MRGSSHCLRAASIRPRSRPRRTRAICGPADLSCGRLRRKLTGRFLPRWHTIISIGPATWYDRNVLISNIKVFDHIGHGKTPVIFVGMDLMVNRRVIIDYAGASLWLAR